MSSSIFHVLKSRVVLELLPQLECITQKPTRECTLLIDADRQLNGGIAIRAPDTGTLIIQPLAHLAIKLVELWSTNNRLMCVRVNTLVNIIIAYTPNALRDAVEIDSLMQHASRNL